MAHGLLRSSDELPQNPPAVPQVHPTSRDAVMEAVVGHVVAAHSAGSAHYVRLLVLVESSTSYTQSRRAGSDQVLTSTTTTTTYYARPPAFTHTQRRLGRRGKEAQV